MPDPPDMSPDHVAPVDRCAEISALLEDPFADRAAVLRGAGLDETTWAAAQERWVKKLAASNSDALVARYGEGYETTLRRLASGGAPIAPAPALDGPAFLSTEEQPWCAEAAPTLRSASSAPPPRLSPAPSPMPPPSAEHPLGTAKLDAGALLKEAVPFAASPLAASPLAETLRVGERLPLPVIPTAADPGSGR